MDLHRCVSILWWLTLKGQTSVHRYWLEHKFQPPRISTPKSTFLTIEAIFDNAHLITYFIFITDLLSKQVHFSYKVLLGSMLLVLSPSKWWKEEWDSTLWWTHYDQCTGQLNRHTGTTTSSFCGTINRFQWCLETNLLDSILHTYYGHCEQKTEGSLVLKRMLNLEHERKTGFI